MAILDLSSFDAALKQLYDDQVVENLVYEDNPFLALCPKNTKFFGKNKPLPVQFGVPQGRSATFATAQANKTASKFDDFIITRKKDYCIASIDVETMEASMNDKGAFLEAAETEINGALHSLARSLAGAMFRDGTGTIGATTETSGTTITLVEPDDVVNFEVGMKIAFNDNAGAARDSGEAIGISAVNRSAGTLTVDTDLNTISGITTLDGINVAGDFNAKISGLAAWLPYGGPSATPFFGVDRTVDSTRLGGVSWDGTSQSIEEAAISLMIKVAREGGKVTHGFVNFERFGDLEMALGSKVQYVEHKVGEIGFRGIRVNGPRGFVDIIPDHNQRSDYLHMLTMKHWKLMSIGTAPKIQRYANQMWIREATEDAVEVRACYFANVGCNAPGYNGVAKLAA